MKNPIISALGVLLIAGSAVQVTPAFARHARSVPAISGDAIRNADGSANETARWCSTEPGNPYNLQADYQTSSAWRALGAWDSSSDCP